MKKLESIPISVAEPRAEHVWVIGLDGATFRILDVFTERGWMPNLANLARKGVAANLRSTLPPITAPAWTSFMTGCAPGQHGVYAFRGPMRGSWERPICNATAIRKPRLWEYLELFGYSAGLINVPMTYPVEPLHGYMVAGMLTPDGDTAVAYPQDVQQQLRSQGYVVDLHIGRREREPHSAEQVVELANDLIDTVQKRSQAALQLLEQRPTTFFAIVFVAPDRIQHYAWSCIEQLIEQPEAAERDPICQRVFAVYQEVDRALGAILARRDEKTTVLIMSDHGFCRLHTRVRLNEWMAKKGWVAFKEGARSARKRAKRLRGWLKRLLPRRFLLWGRRKLTVTHTLDWQRSLAYTGDASENAVRINVKGREPAGTVEAGEIYQRTRAEIIAALTELRDPKTNLHALTNVCEREAIYRGPFLELAPDIVLEPAEGYEFTPEVAYDNSIFVDISDEGRGSHARTGILIAEGPGIKQTSTRGEAAIEDIAPTAMYLLGLPVPSEMDGCVLDDILIPDWPAIRPPQRKPLTDQGLARDQSDHKTYTADEQELLQRRLHDLGYLE
jgi:predicted AlkP superfamily phosphohydrolase/phosphomutase